MTSKFRINYFGPDKRKNLTHLFGPDKKRILLVYVVVPYIKEIKHVVTTHPNTVFWIFFLKKNDDTMYV